MYMDIALMCTIVGCFVALAGWLSKKDDVSRDDGEWRGKVDAKLDIICGVQKDVYRNTQEVHDIRERVVKVEEKLNSTNDRIDRLEETHE